MKINLFLCNFFVAPGCWCSYLLDIRSVWKSGSTCVFKKINFFNEKLFFLYVLDSFDVLISKTEDKKVRKKKKKKVGCWSHANTSSCYFTRNFLMRRFQQHQEKLPLDLEEVACDAMVWQPPSFWLFDFESCLFLINLFKLAINLGL